MRLAETGVWPIEGLEQHPRTVEEMPPRRMGSIRVVVVFSSRLSFSGGPEPPSPAARLLPGPDMVAVDRNRGGVLWRRKEGGGGTSVPCRKQKREIKRGRHCAFPELRRPTPQDGSRIGSSPGTLTAADSAQRRHLGPRRKCPGRGVERRRRSRKWRKARPPCLASHWHRFVPPPRPFCSL